MEQPLSRNCYVKENVTLSKVKLWEGIYVYYSYSLGSKYVRMIMCVQNTGIGE